MFVLHVDLTIKAGLDGALEKTFREVFKPAISMQDGFVEANLLRPIEDHEEYRLSIAFDRRKSQQRWVATDLHRKVWPQLEDHVSRYFVRFYHEL